MSRAKLTLDATGGYAAARFHFFSLHFYFLPNLAARTSCHAHIKHTLTLALLFLGSITAMAAEPESPDRVDPLLSCSTSLLDANTPGQAKLLRVQSGGDGLVRELRETYASRLAGLFWDQQEGRDSRLVVRLTGDDPVEIRKLTVCGEPLTVEFISGQAHMAEDLRNLHAENLEWFRAKSPGLQGTYADERPGEIVLEIYTPEAEGTDIEALTREAESRLGAALWVDMTTAKLEPAILNPEKPTPAAE